MKTLITRTLALALATTAFSAWADHADHTAQHQPVQIEQAWVRATVPQQTATGAFMLITADADSKLVKAASPLSDKVEVHEMKMDNDVMRMRQVENLPLPAGQTVELKPGGYHIMILDLKEQIKEGDHVPLTLTVEDASGQQADIEVQAPARALAAGNGHSGHGDHGQMQHDQSHKH
ncbi:copper chaperone PCu(A)C [Corticimicrobacter populi]|uniref:Transporter n=1 Tax=Corticimicrobacter populi TaxID=2175229 RepID=A0A2V1K2D6_9BURK|nr:copper chaperone PCu(A)C [Corticimicrobacter populi]PWF25404.1 hypothetical protein DD235_04510 [Corticimicrobacter populi]